MTTRKHSPKGKKAPVPVHSRMAPRVEGAEFTEIKATIEGREIDEARKAFSLTAQTAEQRFVYFFDTAKLSLNKARVVVRARRVPGKQHDSTIKIRPVEPRDVVKWQKVKGFKVEADAGNENIVLSASLTRPVEKGLIKKHEAGDHKLAAIFDADQERFLAQMCHVPYKLSSLKQFGPIDVLWWKHEYPGLPVPMTAELWTRGDGERILELSIKVPSAIAAFAAGGFMAFLADLGAEPDNASQAKTKWAMAYAGAPAAAPEKATKPSARKAAKPSAPRAKAKPAPKPVKRSKPKDAKPPEPVVTPPAPAKAPRRRVAVSREVVQPAPLPSGGASPLDTGPQ